MNFKLSTTKIEQSSAALLVVGSDAAAPKTGSSLDRIDKKLGGSLRKILKNEGFKGKNSESKFVHSHGPLKANAVLVIGLTYKDDGDLPMHPLEQLRQAAAAAARLANQKKCKSVAFDLSAWSDRTIDEADQVQAVVEGMELAVYRFEKYLKSQKVAVQSVDIFGAHSNTANRQAITRGQAIAEGTKLARDLVNTPACDMTPKRIAQESRRIRGINCRVYNRSEIARLKMNSFLSVSLGSEQPPALIHMTYRPRSRTKKSIAIVGKGVTFDSGGLSIKPAVSMETMKDDMAGAAAVVGLMATLSKLKPDCTVHGIIAATENMPSGNAVKPGDVVRAMNGKTIEVLNTDAEGRLTLADAIHFVLQKKPDLVIDMATLTGACLVALGERVSGIMGNDDELIDSLIETGDAAGELMWQLPLINEYADQIKSSIADVKNIGGRWGGTITAGLFLKQFVDDTPWAHIDIAGPSWTDKPLPYAPRGGTGCLVNTLTRFILDY